MQGILLSAVLVVVLCSSSTFAAICGTFTAGCGSYYNDPALGAVNFAGTLSFDGLYAGNYTWTRAIFGSTSVPLLPSLYEFDSS